ncbi:hypothetical protein DXG03_008720 [Asterophora parasitica]|uniref:Zn(2)-C6 fungal-type domain-containing protein n=1 Tax=Asterophora parasitica TaxID=117018 RepID=A0A9P7GBQ8_9AGAR|nr:hypothetical protein DXG03_008720 [Asterophora parasitica]
MLEEDELFYATFPLAKQAAIEEWILHMPQPVTMSTTEFPLVSPPQSLHSTMASHYADEDVHPPSHLKVESPNASFSTLHYDYYQPNTPEVDAKGHGSMIHGSYFPVQPSSFFPSPPASPQIIHLASHLVVPSQKREDDIIPNNFTRPSSSGTRDSAAASHGTEATPPPAPICPSPPSLSSVHNGRQFTGDWAADAMAAETHLHAPRPSYAEPPLPALVPWDVPVVEVPSTRRHHLTYRQKRNTRSRSRSGSHPYPSISLESCSESPPTSQMNTPRPRKRVKPGRDKDGKPIMACLFCRGRKIACGPPSKDSHDKTCNQCARRNLECTYPLENRRGMRKPRLKKEDVKPGVSKDPSDVKRCVVVKVKAEAFEDDMEMSDDESGSEWGGDV